MGLEEQLRELLEKLDLTCAMKSSGSRSKRAKLLKREIALLRNKLSQQPSEPPAPGPGPGPGGPEEDTAGPGQEPGDEGEPGVGVAATLHGPRPQGLPCSFGFPLARTLQVRTVCAVWLLACAAS